MVRCPCGVSRNARQTQLLEGGVRVFHFLAHFICFFFQLLCSSLERSSSSTCLCSRPVRFAPWFRASARLTDAGIFQPPVKLPRYGSGAIPSPRLGSGLGILPLGSPGPGPSEPHPSPCPSRPRNLHLHDECPVGSVSLHPALLSTREPRPLRRALALLALDRDPY